MTQEEFFKRYTYSPSRDRIGGGGFGTVYKAYDNVLHREVAIKVSEVKTTADGKKTFSLKDEFEALNHVPQHPNIANYEAFYSFEMPNGIFDYAVMQYYPDGNLNNAIKQGLSDAQKEDIATQLLEGIAFLHQHKVVHRDLKPGNILIVKHGGRIIPLITDFGLSKAAELSDGSMFTNSFGGGTPRYSSPEQLQGQPLRLNTDLWSYGSIMFEIFTGKQLFSPGSGAANSAQADMEIFNKIIRGDVQGLGTMPEKWRRVAERCLVMDPAKRAKSAEELQCILNDDEEATEVAGLDSPPKPVAAPVKPIKDTPKGGKKKTALWIALAAVLVGAIIAILLLRQPKEEKALQKFYQDQESNEQLTKDIAESNVLVQRSFNTAGWERFDYVQDTIEFNEPTVFNLTLRITFTDEYPNDYFQMGFDLCEQSLPLRSKRYKFDLKDEQGRWGVPKDDQGYTFVFPIDQMSIMNQGKCLFRVEQVMPTTPLLGVKKLELIKEEASSPPANASVNGHEYVDLGLPSGTLWATCNLGADTPGDCGNHYAWGETQTKSIYNFATYKYANGAYDKLTKYCSKSNLGDNGFTDNLTTLQASDDPATVNWGSGWRTPTKAQWDELLNNTTNQWTSQYGVNGWCFTAENGQSLFLPAAGNRWIDEHNGVGTGGFYWSRSLNTGYPTLAWYLLFGSSGCHVYDYRRNFGCSVRPVREKK